MKQKPLDWDTYLMDIASVVSIKSHCLSRKVGAVAVRDHGIVSTGYNGPPKNYPHCEGNICPRKLRGFKSGEGLEFCPAAHAERNVLINAGRMGHELKGCTLYLTMTSPCRECAKEIVNAEIVEVVAIEGPDYPESGITGLKILEVCGVIFRRIKYTSLLERLLVDNSKLVHENYFLKMALNQ